MMMSETRRTCGPLPRMIADLCCAPRQMADGAKDGGLGDAVSLAWPAFSPLQEQAVAFTKARKPIVYMREHGRQSKMDVNTQKQRETTRQTASRRAVRLATMHRLLRLVPTAIMRDCNPQLADSFFDLASRLLVLNPAHRLTAEEALRHPYFQHATR